GDCVLVGMGRPLAAVEPVRPGGAGHVEVPVRADRLPLATAVRGLEDLLEPEIDVVCVLGVDREELVVPGLDAGVISRSRLERGATVRQVPPLGDLVPRAG